MKCAKGVTRGSPYTDSGEFMQQASLELIEDALGFFTSGCFLMTAAFDGTRGGMLVSSVQRVSDDPALLCVAARKGHKIDPLIRDSRSFAIGIVDPGDKLIRRRFRLTDTAPVEHKLVGEDDPFDAIDTKTLVTGAPILPRCVTWFDCEVMRRVDLESDTELFVGMIVSVWHHNERVQVERVAGIETGH